MINVIRFSIVVLYTTHRQIYPLMCALLILTQPELKGEPQSITSPMFKEARDILQYQSAIIIVHGETFYVSNVQNKNEVNPVNIEVKAKIATDLSLLQFVNMLLQF